MGVLKFLVGGLRQVCNCSYCFGLNVTDRKKTVVWPVCGSVW